jgi:uncharacterized protein (TIGR03435 family)
MSNEEAMHNEIVLSEVQATTRCPAGNYPVAGRVSAGVMRSAFFLAATLVFPAFGQDVAHPKFQTASVQPTYVLPAPCDFEIETGGPGTARPTTLTIRSARPGDLLTYAYDVTPERIVGLTRDSFAWNGTIRYNVVAKVPLGSTKSDVGPMLQQLLTERLHLAAQRETRSLEAYELTVSDGGVKMRRSSAIRKPGDCGGMGGVNGVMQMKARHVAIPDFAGLLADLLGHPVFDKTALTGRYDFDFHYSMDGLAGPDGMGSGVVPSATAAGASQLIADLQQQLGLNLSRETIPLEVVVVKHLDQTLAKPLLSVSGSSIH